MEQNLKLTDSLGVFLSNPSIYCRLIGRLIYLAITRLDLVFAVNILSQFMHAPRQPHYDAALRILRYLKATPGQGLFYPTANSLQVFAYSDSD
ncbi:hypothetical protein CJ030_MR4G029201 [Morella rubra]|uniref:Mitochondrial protein n=1 Tax=Morella rubra TaxID=262757 RepID=A0A6A1VUH1_9ROSI|nr:hypothetical protein CJ030_MR4G029201 [Morella rubra]